MSSTQERIKKRREYLKRKGSAYARMILAALLVVPCATLAFLIMGVQPFIGFQSGLSFFSVAILISTLSFCFGVAAFRLADSARKAHQAAKHLPYVPPITAETLPAEEVLVRGSEEPVQEQSKVLLRGINSCTGTAAQELLRSSQAHE